VADLGFDARAQRYIAAPHRPSSPASHVFDMARRTRRFTRAPPPLRLPRKERLAHVTTSVLWDADIFQYRRWHVPTTV
jgi:hypothetical protein